MQNPTLSVRRRIPRAGAAILVLAASTALVAAACTGTGAAPTPTPTPTPVPTTVPAADVAKAATALASLTSYRFHVTTTAKNVTGTSTMVRNGTVDASGTWISKPTRAASVTVSTTTSASSFLPGKIQFVVIGEEAWYSLGGELVKVPVGLSPDVTQGLKSYDPDALATRTFDVQNGTFTEVGIETKNGVQARHLTADQSTLKMLSSQHGFEGTWTMDLWIAVDGGYPVGAVVSGTGSASGVNGEYRMTLDITNVNDTANVVARPS